MVCNGAFVCEYNNHLYRVRIYDVDDTVSVVIKPLNSDVEIEYYNDGRSEHVAVRLGELVFCIGGFESVGVALSQIASFLRRMWVASELYCLGDGCEKEEL